MAYSGKDFYQNIALGSYSNIVPWSKIGYTPNMAVTECDVWSYGATQPVYIFPTAEAGMEIKGNHANDTGTVIKGNAQGASAVVCDATGNTTTLIDTSVNFTSATSVAVGDLLLVDPAGTVPEWGYITSFDSTSVTFAAGLSEGGDCAAERAYSIIDASPVLGALAVLISYLDDEFTQKYEIVIMNGTGVVPTVNTNLYRINGMRVIGTGTAAGFTNKPTGAIQLRNLADTPVYTNITAGFTRARNAAYTVPAGKTLYVTTWTSGFGIVGNTKGEYCRLFTRANLEPDTALRTGTMFYTYTELITVNSIFIEFPIPTKLPAQTDIRVSGLASAAGVATSALRGFLTTP